MIFVIFNSWNPCDHKSYFYVSLYMYMYVCMYVFSVHPFIHPCIHLSIMLASPVVEWVEHQDYPRRVKFKHSYLLANSIVTDDIHCLKSHLYRNWSIARTYEDQSTFVQRAIFQASDSSVTLKSSYLEATVLLQKRYAQEFDILKNIHSIDNGKNRSKKLILKWKKKKKIVLQFITHFRYILLQIN